MKIKMKFYTSKKLFIIGVFAGFLFLFGVASPSGFVKAANVGDIVNFNVDKGFDASSRTQLPAVLVSVNPRLYFYVESLWWNAQTPSKQAQILADLNSLSDEFDSNIYPTLTSTFGSVWDPGIDNDSRVTVLFESMNSAEGGYFREDDEYDKLQLPDSNEREMVYLSVSGVDSPNAKIILGHEYTHLITFNQKNKIFNVEEDTWLNEARADYSSTILGYDNTYIGSNLQQRVSDFIEDPSDSFTDWSGTKYDYAAVDLFMHYLVDHYGVNILSDSLKSKAIGIESINEALSRDGYKTDFSQIFTNWTIALVVNDCSESQDYCYSNPNLVNLRVSPTLIFLPLSGDTSLSSINATKNWSGNWQKIIGGSGDLSLDFSSLSGLNFQVPYILYDKNNSYSVKFLQLDSNEKGEIIIKDFGTNYKSLIIVPSLQSKLTGFDTPDIIYPYSFTVSITGNTSTTDQTVVIQKLLAQIASLKTQIAAAQSSGGGPTTQQSCSQFNNNLYFGMSNNGDVSCLQQFLKNQGAGIYPEGLVTGNFGGFTKAAVVRFQEKYAADILAPAGLSSGSGYVGTQTRAKINSIINGR